MVLLLGLVSGALAQPEPAAADQRGLFTSLVPDATVTIWKHPMGADMVEIAMTAPGYPAKLLGDQIAHLGKYLGSDPRGLQIWDYDLDPDKANMHFTKATFAVDGVINRQVGAFRLNPFVKAFAGAEAPWTVHCMDLVFQGEAPTSKMIRLWRSKSAILEARYDQSPDRRLSGVDYRVRLLAQDPARMDIPEPSDDRPDRQKTAPAPSGSDWASIAVLLIAATAVGALVYSLLLRGRPNR